MTSPSLDNPNPVLPAWWDVIRALNATAKSGACGVRLITVSVLVDRDGVPVRWTNPKVCRLQPGRRGVEEFLDLLEQENVE